MSRKRKPTHFLSDVDVRRMTVVKRGANGQRWFLRKSDEEDGVSVGEPAPLLKGADDWSTAYVVVAAPGHVEGGGQGTDGVFDVWKSEEEIEKAAHRFMGAGGEVNRLVHGSDTDPDLKVVESAVALADFEVDGTKIAKGSWYVGLALDAAARAMVESGEMTGVSIEGTGVRAEVGKAAPSDRSVMVALYPDAATANALALDGGEHPDDLHLTLAFLGEIAEDRLHAVESAVRSAVQRVDTDGLTGQVAGPGTFVPGQGPGSEKPVHYASVDAPSLPELRQRIVQALHVNAVPARADHGFTPHITLKYGGARTPKVAAQPVRFDSVHVVRGDETVAEIGLTPLLKGKLDRSPKSNWVEDAGGLPRYIEDIADSLHRERGMTIQRAIQTAISRVRVWAAGGDGVKPDTRAKAVAALAQWEALKAKNRARSAVTKETKMSKALEAIQRIVKGKTLSDADDEALADAISKAYEPEGDRGSGDPAGTVEKTEPAGAHEEDTMDETKLAEALAKALKPTNDAIKEQGERLAKIEKAQEAEPEVTVESLGKDVDDLVANLGPALDRIAKGIDALGEGSSQQAPATAPVTKSAHGGPNDGQGARAADTAGIIFG